MYLRATERRKTESSRNKTRFRVIACICTRNGTSFNMIVAKQEDHCVARTNRKSRFSQKDGASNFWDRSSRTTNQNDPIGPTRSFGPIRLLGPTRSLGSLSNIFNIWSHLQDRTVIWPLSNGYNIWSHLQDWTVIWPLSNGYNLWSHRKIGPL